MARRKLYLSVWRDITSHKMQFAGLILMISLGAGSLGLFIPAYLNMSNTYEATYERLHLADFRISTLIQTESIPASVVDNVMDDIMEDYPIQSYEKRIVYEVTSLKNESDSLGLVAIRLIGMNVTEGRHPTVNDIEVVDGRWFVEPDNWDVSRPFNEYVALADAKLAEYHDLEPNTRFDLLVEGNVNQTTEIRVVGSVGTAEYLWLAASWIDLMPSSRRFGLMFMPLTSIQHMIGFGANEVNDFCVRMEPGTSIETRNAAMDEIEQELLDRGYNILPPTPKEDEPSYAGLQYDLEGMAEMVVIFPVFILLLAVFSTYITMARLVNAQRQEVGVALSMGYSKGDVYRKYLTYGLIVGFLGGILGILIGEYSAIWFTDLYLDMMSVPFRQYGFYPDIVATNIVVSMTVCLIGCIIPARNSSRLIPAQAMRDDPAQVYKGKVTLVEKLVQKLTGAEPRVRTKVIFRNIFRNRRRTVSTLLGIVMSFILICSTAGANDSFEATIDSMAVREGWDLQVQYTDFKIGEDIRADIETLESWEEVESAHPGIAFSTVLSSLADDIETVLQIRIQDPDIPIHNFEFEDEGEFSDGGIVITRGSANKLGVGRGDQIKVMHPSFNITSLFPLTYTFEMVNSTVTVTGVTKEATSLVCWIGSGLADELIGGTDFDANTIYIKMHDPTPENIDSLKQKVYLHMNDVRSALAVSDTARDMNEYMDTMRIFLYFLVGFSFVLAATIIMTTTVINVLERRREVATVLTMGASHSHAQKTFLAENLVVTGAGVLLGVPMSFFALEELGAAFTTDFFTFIITIYPMTIVWCVIGMFVSALFVQWLFVRRFRKMDLAQETKRRISG